MTVKDLTRRLLRRWCFRLRHTPSRFLDRHPSLSRCKLRTQWIIDTLKPPKDLERLGVKIVSVLPLLSWTVYTNPGSSQSGLIHSPDSITMTVRDQERRKGRRFLPLSQVSGFHSRSRLMSSGFWLKWSLNSRNRFLYIWYYLCDGSYVYLLLVAWEVHRRKQG